MKIVSKELLLLGLIAKFEWKSTVWKRKKKKNGIRRSQSGLFYSSFVVFSWREHKSQLEMNFKASEKWNRSGKRTFFPSTRLHLDSWALVADWRWLFKMRCSMHWTHSHCQMLNAVDNNNSNEEWNHILPRPSDYYARRMADSVFTARCMQYAWHYLTH